MKKGFFVKAMYDRTAENKKRIGLTQGYIFETQNGYKFCVEKTPYLWNITDYLSGLKIDSFHTIKECKNKILFIEKEITEKLKTDFCLTCIELCNKARAEYRLEKEKINKF